MNQTNNYKIISLPKDEWKDYKIPMRYTTYEYYDVVMKEHANGFQVELEKKPLTAPISHYPEEYDWPDRLYEDCWPDATAWGVLDESGQLIACIETTPEAWFGRLRIQELWVHEDYRRQGIAHKLMAVAKEQAKTEKKGLLYWKPNPAMPGLSAFTDRKAFPSSVLIPAVTATGISRRRKYA